MWEETVVGPHTCELALCAPNAEKKRRPTGPESMELIRDATQLLAQLQAAGAGAYTVNAAGSGGRLELPAVGLPARAPAQQNALQPVAPAGAGVGAGRRIARRIERNRRKRKRRPRKGRTKRRRSGLLRRVHRPAVRNPDPPAAQVRVRAAGPLHRYGPRGWP